MEHMKDVSQIYIEKIYFFCRSRWRNVLQDIWYRTSWQTNVLLKKNCFLSDTVKAMWGPWYYENIDCQTVRSRYCRALSGNVYHTAYLRIENGSSGVERDVAHIRLTLSWYDADLQRGAREDVANRIRPTCLVQGIHRYTDTMTKELADICLRRSWLIRIWTCHTIAWKNTMYCIVSDLCVCADVTSEYECGNINWRLDM